MTKNCCYFLNPSLAITLNNDWHKQPGCHSQPFFKVPLENIVVDELHLMLRVMDRFEEGLILDIMKWDEVNISTKLLVCIFTVNGDRVTSTCKEHFYTRFDLSSIIDISG